jgi:hypothetical protein
MAGALLAMLLLAESQAIAVTPDRCQADRACREQSELAAQLAAQTRYDEALPRYEQAYQRVPEPRLLVNIGRCHYRLGRARKALEYFENFQKAGVEVESELGARVSQFIAEAKLAILSDTVRPVEKPVDKLPEPAPAPLTVPPPPPSTSEPRLADAPRDKRPAWRIAVGVSAIGVGALLLGLGGGALSADGKCRTVDETSPDRCQSMVNSQGVLTTMLIDGKSTGIGLLIGGGIIAVGGALLIALPGPRRKNLSLRRIFDANALGPGSFALRIPGELSALAVDRGGVQ